MTSHQVVSIIIALFPVSEIVLGLRKKATAGESSVQDQGTLRILWVVIMTSLLLATLVSRISVTRIPLSPSVTDLLALFLSAGGLALRWGSILTLGRFFTVNVAVHPGHEVVRSGPYRLIRHPSYTGLLIAFAGVGFYLANWLSLCLILVPITLAIIHRIKKEEEILIAALGSSYLAYRATTKRLVPWIF